MVLGRIVRNGKDYEFVELDLAEAGKAIDVTIETNLVVWRLVRKKVQEHLEENGPGLTERQKFTLCCKMFNACALKSYTALATELDRKVFVTKNLKED